MLRTLPMNDSTNPPVLGSGTGLGPVHFPLLLIVLQINYAPRYGIAVPLAR